MAVGSGLGDSFGIATQSTYNTYTAPTRWYEVEAAPFKKNKRIVQGGGVSGGVLGNRLARRAYVGEDAAGSASLEVVDKTMGLLLSHCTGTVASGVVNGSGYTYDFPVVDNFGRFFTSQFGIVDLTGTSRPYTGLGCKITAFEFTCDLNGLLMLSVVIDARQMVESQTLVAPSYTSGIKPFHWGQFAPSFGGTVTAGIVATGTAALGVRRFSLRFERPQATDLFYAGGAGLKTEPVMNGKWNITGSLSADLVDKTQLADRFASDTATSLLLPFTSTTQISAGVFPTVAFHLPSVVFDDGNPTIDGVDVNTSTYPFQVLVDANGNAQATIRTVTADAAL